MNLQPRSHFEDLRGRRVHWREWGTDPAAPIVVLVHGWMDNAYTFQFLVNAFSKSWRLLAPDLRGFGQTEWSRERASGYWFHDYIADLDAFLGFIAPNAPVHLVGHSLGGNIACIYAGIRPERIKTLSSLDGFGVPRGKPSQAPEKMVKWLDAIAKGESIRPYPDIAAVAARLKKNDEFLSDTQALELAEHWAAKDHDGQWQVRADPAHKFPFSTVYHLEESIAVWQRVSAPTLWLGASHSHIAQWLGYGRDDPAEMGTEAHHSEEFRARLAAFADMRFEVIANATHNLHHERASQVAARLERHFNRRP